MADTLAHLKREGLYHLGIQKTPSRNALSHQNAMRDAIVLRDIFRLLHKRLGQQSFTCQFRGWRERVCVGWVWGEDIKASRIMLLDSSVITLCLNLFNRAHYSKDSEFIGICVSQKNLWDTCA